MTNALLTSALWGRMFQDQEVAALFSAHAMVHRFLAFEMAWTRAMVSSGAVSTSIGEQALEVMAATEIDVATLGSGSDRDGLPIPRFVEVLREGLALDVAAAIHTGATSQDVVDTSLNTAAKEVLALFRSRLDGVITRLDDLFARFGSVPMMARTRMQAALPISVGDRIDDWRAPLVGLRDDLDGLIAQVAVVQIGGPVGQGPASKAFAMHVAEALGLQSAPVWHTDRRRILDVGHWVTKVAGSLGKLGQDIALMAQQSVDEVRLDGGGGSSAMPHKQNPVRAEIIVAQARVVAGQQGTLAQAMIHEQERSGAAWALEWMLLPAMLETTGAALTNAADLLDQITAIGAPQ